MVWINAALAFVLSMILFSTIVSGATETVHRFLKLREQGLRIMLERLFEYAVWPRVRSRLSNPDADTLRGDFIEVLTRNWAVDRTIDPVAVPQQPEAKRKPLGRFGGLYRNWFASRSLDSLSVQEFGARLRDTKLGQAIVDDVALQTDDLVREFATRFERLGNDSTSFFRQRARALSIVFGVVLALALNIDAVSLFSAFVIDPQVAARVLEQTDKIVISSQKAAAVAEATDVQAPASALDTVGGRIVPPTALGLPIGTSFYPWCGAPNLDPRCAKSAKAINRPRRLMVGLNWLLSVLLAGVLIGQGSPFWFSLFTRLSTTSEMLRSLGLGRESRDDRSKARSAGDAAPPTETKPLAPVQAFNEAFSRPLPRPARILLSRSGLPL